MTAKWQAGHTYVAGDLVKPSTVALQATQVTNGYFEDGATGWDFEGGCQLSTSNGYGSPNCCVVPGATTGGVTLNQVHFIMRAGQTISATCMIQQGASDVDHTRGYAQVYFYDASDAQIGNPVSGNIVNDGRHGEWHPSSVTATAPANTAYARCGIYLYQNSDDPVWGDNLVATYSYRTLPGLLFRATQADPGKSGSSEPDWPVTTGISITDNQVTWEGFIGTRLIWEASPLLRSGDTEPVWPTGEGAVVHDGTIDWVANSRRVEDPNCPNTKVVAIMASKVFAVDKDIVRFSATVNPLDWTTPQDAGYLPTGLQQANSNDAAVLAPYRSNLTVFNASTFQNWQVDPDPANMAILDQMEGIGSVDQQAAYPVAQDLYYLAALGVRSVTVTASANSLEAGDIGMPVDSLVQSAINAAPEGFIPRAYYYPGAGQFWLAMPWDNTDPDFPGLTVVFVFTINASKGKWSRYVYPFAIDGFSQLGNDLYIRSGDVVRVVDESLDYDDMTPEGGSANFVNFPGRVQWPWLNMGDSGRNKMMRGFDYTGSGQAPSISIGYDQRDVTMFTPPYLLNDDTLTGGFVGLEVTGPTFSIRMDFVGGETWSSKQVLVYTDPTRAQP